MIWVSAETELEKFHIFLLQIIHPRNMYESISQNIAAEAWRKPENHETSLGWAEPSSEEAS